MTDFLSSFLIDPVVRQARRLSRTEAGPAPDPPPASNDDSHDLACSDGEEVQEEDTGAGDPEDNTPEDGGGGILPIPRWSWSVIETSTPSSTSNTAAASESAAPAGTHAEADSPAASRHSSRPVLNEYGQPAPAGPGDQEQGPHRHGRRRSGTDPTQTPGAAASVGLYITQPQSRLFRASYPSSINEASLRVHELRNVPQRTSRDTGMSETQPAASSPEPGHASLPEDDGMGQMRRRILGVQRMGVSSGEKSRLVHELMTERYSSSLAASHMAPRARGTSPASLVSQDRPVTPGSSHSMGTRSLVVSPQTSQSSVSEDRPVSAEDLKPTHWVPSDQDSDPRTASATPTGSRKSSLDSGDRGRVLGCQHYKRNVKLQCSQCLRWYTCRFCHDEVENHALIRKDTKNMLCMLCGCAQPAAGDCCNCGESAACYYCDICKLWDNEATRSIYHCDDCGICRVGKGLGKDFYHCKTCLACLSISKRDTHRCVERSMDCDCPICGDYMFTSPQTVVVMRCGHSIHYSCYKQHMQSSFKCPICSRSIINMEMTFRNLDRSIQAQPMPPQFRDTKALVYCNDCSAKSSVAYHWLGLKCAICDSYNTAQLRISSETAASSPPEVVNAPGPSLVVSEASLQPPEFLQEPVRGRSRTINNQISRIATSASALESQRRLLVADIGPRLGRSLSEHNQATLVAQPDFDDDDAVNSGSEDEVEFWGGENPKDRAPQTRAQASPAEADSGSDYTDDEDMDANNEYDTDDDSSEDDMMDIVGHR